MSTKEKTFVELVTEDKDFPRFEYEQIIEIFHREHPLLTRKLCAYVSNLQAECNDLRERSEFYAKERDNSRARIEANPKVIVSRSIYVEETLWISKTTKCPTDWKDQTEVYCVPVVEEL